MLQEALSSGLISASADSRTVIFLSSVEKDHAGVTRLTEWAESVGLAIEYMNGALGLGWRSYGRWGSGAEYSGFMKWVDEEAARREVVAGGRKIKR